MRSTPAPPASFSALSLALSASALLLITWGAAASLAGCDGCDRSDPAAGGAVLTLGAYTTPREAYAALLPAFREAWRAQGGGEVALQESFLGSGAQARAIVGGFEADVAALSLEPDIETIRAAGLIGHDWKGNEHGGMITRSVVVIGVREGNPKGIRDWADLARPGVEVLTPNVRTSGGAMWNVLAVYGAGLRGKGGGGEVGAVGGQEAAVALLAGVLRNVRIMDRSARDSMLTFERGVGDAIITYENEMLVGRSKGQRYDYVVPASTVVIENPVALIDASIERHGNRALAEGFVAFLWSPAAQRVFAEHGLRPVVASVAAEVAGRFAPVGDGFTVGDLGGWAEVQRVVFGEGGVYERALARSRADDR